MVFGHSIGRRPKMLESDFFFSLLLLILVTIEIRQTFSIIPNAFVDALTHAHTHTQTPATQSHTQCPPFIVAYHIDNGVSERVSDCLGCMGARLCAARIRVIVIVHQCRRLVVGIRTIVGVRHERPKGSTILNKRRENRKG